MKNTYFTASFLVALLLATVFSTMPAQAEAATATKYVWGGQQFSSFDALVNHLRVVYGEDTGNQTGNTMYSDSEVDVTTKSATKIGTTQATLRGVVDMNKSDYAHVWFEYGKNMNSLSNDTATGYAKKKGTTPYSGTVVNLEKYTRYYFRAMAEDDNGDIANGKILSFTTGSTNTTDDDEDEDDDDSNGDEPTVETDDVKSIDEDSAKAYGSVDMNGYKNGVVFFVFGEDEDQVEDVEDEYDSYSDIDEDDEDLQKVKVYSDLDKDGDFVLNMRDLSADTKYYYAIGVSYEDEDGDDVITLGSVESFRTDDEDGDNNDDDNDNDEDEPEVDTGTVKNINDDSADAFGEVDMNDFEDGLVFFVYGEDKSLLEEVEDEYDTYADIDEDGDDLQKVKVHSGLDSDGEFEVNMYGLDSNTTIYYAIGVEYEDEDGDDVLKLGSIKSFVTD